MPEYPIRLYRYYSDLENESRAIHTRQGSVTSGTRELYIYIYEFEKLKEHEYMLGNAFFDIYDAAQPLNSYIWSSTRSPKTGKYEIYGSYENSGKIIVTRGDKEKLILSGTFSGKLKEVDGEEIIEIKDGRFDINLKTLQP